MSEFSDQYFRELAPQQRRYDTPVSDQLHFCVFPNGVKSWVFLYEVDGHVRRRTIGLFPEMSYAQALTAIDPNRRIAKVDASEHRRDAGKGTSRPRLRVPPAVEKLMRRITPMDVLTAGGTAIVALAILVLVGRSGDPTPPETASTPPPPTRPAPQAEPVARTAAAAETPPDAPAERAPADSPTVEEARPEPEPPAASRGTITFVESADTDPVPAERPAEAEVTPRVADWLLALTAKRPERRLPHGKGDSG